MQQLTAPSRELALRIFREVDFKDRLIGRILHLRGGIRTRSIYTLEEAFLLLKEPLPQIDLTKLENWIRAVIKDGELADRIKEAIAQRIMEQGRLQLIRDLVGWRLIQCWQLVKPTPEISA